MGAEWTLPTAGAVGLIIASRLGVALTVAGAVLFSLKAVVVKLSYGYTVDPVSLQTLRMAMALPIYLVIALLLHQRRPRPLTPRQWAGVTGAGLCGYHLASVLDLTGLLYVSAGLERLVLYAYPTLVLIFSRVLFGRPIRRIELGAIALSYIGLAVVFAQDLRLGDGGVLIGGLLVFASAAAYALFIIASGRLIPAVGSMRFTCYAMAAAGAGIGLHFALARPSDILALPAPVYWLGIVLALGCTVLPSFMLAAGIGRIGPERAALIGMIGPVSTLIAAYLVLGEPITPAQIFGGGLIIAGVLWMSLGPRSAAKATDFVPPVAAGGK